VQKLGRPAESCGLQQDRVCAPHALTKAHGLSLADRACLALAKRLDLPVVTADRDWAGLDLGITVQLIR
jgi:PIN domain nuclease of toxin-antitoxin system